MELKKKSLNLEGFSGCIHETRKKSLNLEGFGGIHEMKKLNKL